MSAETSFASRVARARWSALFTEATLVSSSSATSLACQRSTSQRIRHARCRGGRCCSAATKASRIVSRETASSAGSGVGCSHVTSPGTCRFSTIGSPAGPRSIGRARRSRPFSMSRQTFVAIR